jgi:hypothetical protein
MGALEALQAAVESQTAQIAGLAQTIAQLQEKIRPGREVYTLRDIAELPEAPSLKSLQNWRSTAPWKLPGHGKPDGFARDGQAAWYRETVEAWRRELLPSPFGPSRGRRRRIPAEQFQTKGESA